MSRRDFLMVLLALALLGALVAMNVWFWWPYLTDRF